MSRPYILMISPTGARRTQADHAWLPVTPDEVAVEVKACLEAGAGAVHVHVRNDDQSHSLDANRYRVMLAAIHEAVGDNLFVQITTEAVGIYQPQQQMDVVREIKPECASFAIRELVPDGAHEEAAAEFFAWVKDEGIVPQFLIYEAHELARFKQLIADGILPFKTPFTLFGLGYHGTRYATPQDVEPFVAEINALELDMDWGVCAFGRREAECVAAAFEHGGHVRVGFENNIETPDGEPLTSVAQSVGYARERLDALDAVPMTGPEIRSYLQGRSG